MSQRTSPENSGTADAIDLSLQFSDLSQLSSDYSYVAQGTRLNDGMVDQNPSVAGNVAGITAGVKENPKQTTYANYDRETYLEDTPPRRARTYAIESDYWAGKLEKPPEKTRVRYKGFNPEPYVFVIDGEEVMPDTVGAARQPPYWLLVDHLFAVIFCMCSSKFKTEPSLGASQLAWALEILTTVKSRRGTYHKDVQTLMDAIEDRLLDCYAAIGQKIQAEIAIDGARSQETKVPTRNLMDASVSRLSELLDESGNELEGQIQRRDEDYEQFEERILNLDMTSSSPKSSRTVFPEIKTPREMLIFLNSWRKDQVARMQKEVERLTTIDDVMKNLEERFGTETASGGVNFP